MAFRGVLLLYYLCTLAVCEPPFNFNLWLPQPRSRARYVTSQGKSALVFRPFLQSFFSGRYDPKLVPLPFNLEISEKGQLETTTIASINQNDSKHGQMLLLYIHMPKTGGQTFHRVLVNSFKGCELNDLLCHPVYDTAELVNEDTNSPVSSRLDITFAAPPKFNNLFVANQSAIAAFFSRYAAGLGHMDVSVGSRLPHRRMVFITVLREPVSRLDSLFDYMSAASKHVVECIDASNQGVVTYPDPLGPAQTSDIYLKQVCSEPMIRRMATENISLATHLRLIRESFVWRMHHHSKAEPFILGPTCLPPNMTFPQFIKTIKDVEYDNFMTRMLTGTTTRSLHSGLPSLSPARTLELAKTMLLSSPFVGLQDRFQDSVELFLWTFGFPPSSIDSEFMFNKSEKNPVLTKEESNIVREMDFLDIQLYEFGKGLFEKRFTQMRADKLAKNIK